MRKESLIATTLALTSRVAFTQVRSNLFIPGRRHQDVTSVFVPLLSGAPFSAFVDTE
jgi:hypothetical protein